MRPSIFNKIKFWKTTPDDVILSKDKKNEADTSVTVNGVKFNSVTEAVDVLLNDKEFENVSDSDSETSDVPEHELMLDESVNYYPNFVFKIAEFRERDDIDYLITDKNDFVSNLDDLGIFLNSMNIIDKEYANTIIWFFLNMLPTNYYEHVINHKDRIVVYTFFIKAFDPKNGKDLHIELHNYKCLQALIFILKMRLANLNCKDCYSNRFKSIKQIFDKIDSWSNWKPDMYQIQYLNEDTYAVTQDHKSVYEDVADETENLIETETNDVKDGEDEVPSESFPESEIGDIESVSE